MLLFEDKVPANIRPQFIAKLRQVSANLGINPNWLMGVIELESAGTFSPSITNSIGATGLIQFMPTTAAGLGTSTFLLRQMSAVNQLDWVERYYRPYKTRIKAYRDLYIATLFPAALGQAKNFVLQTSRLPAHVIARANPLFDTNKDNRITVGEIEKKLLERLPLEWANRIKQNSNWVLLLLLLGGGTLAAWRYRAEIQKSLKNVGW
jgi:hypothetical protein